ncbi:hypothetical protein [Streptomyces sp. NBC_01304]|uniref:hypothetical protein n=1 Tax=Streptomyces sp. NBC_01304 TaxID=2903818 RepID=UPI002E0E6C62|nr:hypothetical protein OG430_48525 [Streptomyces sp. NBC_01304]
MATKKDLNKLRDQAEQQGFVLKETKRKHYLVYKPIRDGKETKLVFVTSMPGTPSEYRGLKNAMAALKRAGFIKP